MSGTKECCRAHPDEIYTFYCRTHDMVYCPVCTVSSHGECVDVYFINEAPPIGENAEEELNRRFADVVAMIDELKRPIESKHAAHIHEKTKILNELSTLRDELVAKVDVLISKARDEIQAEYQTGEDQFNEDLEKLSIVLTAVECAKSRSNLSAKKTKEQALVDLKLGHHRLSTVQDMANGLRLSKNEKVVPKLFLDTNAITVSDESIVKKSKVKATAMSKEPNSVIESNKEVDISLPGTSMSSDVTGICALPDKTFLLCDHNNKHIKWLKHDKLARSVPMTFKPFDACVVSDREIAVTAPQQRQIYFLFTFDFRKLRSFKTAYPCKGITSNREHLFTACSSWNDDSPGCILEYDKKGTIIREYGLLLPSTSIALLPERICLDRQGALLFTDPRHGVFRLGLGIDSNIEHLYKDQGVSGLCVAEEDRILVCQIQSDRLRAISIEGEELRNFELPEVQWKVSMTFENESSTLVIGSLNSKSARVIRVGCT